MSKYGVVCLVAALLMVGVARAADEEESKDHYPLAWTQIDFKPIVDNDRLFKKYKDCLITEKPVGCPRDVSEFKSKCYLTFCVCLCIVYRMGRWLREMSRGDIAIRFLR